MRGEILSFDAMSGEGLISGDDYGRYGFSASDARSPSLLRAGARVEFSVLDNDRAASVDVIEERLPQADGAHGKFDLGRVVQRTFASIGQNWAIFFGGAALLTGLPSAAAAWGQVTMTLEPGVLPGLAWAVGALLNLIGSYLLQAMVLKAAINGFNGKSTTFSSAFEVAVRMALPLFGLAILVGLAMIAGLILLIVPAIFLAIIWCVAAPVLVAEKRDVIESMRRSSELTKGHRWSVFGLLLIYLALWFVISLAVGGVFVAIAGLGGLPIMATTIINPLINMLSGVLASAGVAALYYELRSAKEGAGPEELAAIFD